MTWYFDFFNRFRSPPDIVRQHQSEFLKYFTGCNNVLSIGCGRGEFLEALDEQGIGCTGIDIDDKMVAYSRDKGLNVYRADAVSYLQGLDNDSLDGIFIDDLIEHLDTSYLIRMLKLCCAKIRDEKYMVTITINPLTWTAYADAYLLDVTHKRPVHPKTLRYFLGCSGFKDIKLEFFTYLPQGRKLRKIEITPDMSDRESEIARICNDNADMLNESVFGPENYVAIAKK